MDELTNNQRRILMNADDKPVLREQGETFTYDLQHNGDWVIHTNRGTMRLNEEEARILLATLQEALA